MKKKIALMTLLLVAVFSIASVANAALFSSAYINICDAQMIRSSNRVDVTFNISGREIMDVLGAKTVVIQEQAPGSTQWVAVATITSDNNPSMLGYNKRQHASYVSYSGIKSGYSYRAKVYFYAEKGGYDTAEFITGSV